jgi:hypothetical protein
LFVKTNKEFIEKLLIRIARKTTKMAYKSCYPLIFLRRLFMVLLGPLALVLEPIGDLGQR